MTRNITQRALAAALVAASVGVAVAETADAVVPGRNGRIAFTSGRDAGDNLAKIFFREAIGSTGFGGLSPAPIELGGGQSRHASWSPDRTKVVFANGTPGAPATEQYDLYVKDFVTGQLTFLDGLEIGDGLSSDHPAWSPDGTRIAYERSSAKNSANREIMVKRFGTSEPALALTATPQTELKPAWSADSKTLYFARQNGTAQKSNYDIYEVPAAGGTATEFIYDPDFDEYQPAVSADGKQLCFTQQSKPGDPSSADIHITPLVGTGLRVAVSRDTTKGDINCTWSPDGKRIAYTNGVFGQGRLVMVNADNTTNDPIVLEDDEGSNNFDGNADWAADGSPECEDRTATVKAGETTTLVVECADTGPAYEQSDTSGFVRGVPANGTVSDEQPTASPSTVRYTPNPGFTGTDTIVYSAFDRFGFGTDEGTITITVEPAPATGDGPTPDGGQNGDRPDDGGVVKDGGQIDGGDAPANPKCAGATATIVGTSRRDTITGTRGRDVIVAKAGNDVIRSLGGNDLVCAGRGSDRVSAGRGADRVSGSSGKDRLAGGRGADRLSGGAARDRLTGGAGRDRCTGGAGRDRAASCESRIRIP